jgi:copper(I)-binding protein
MAFSQIVTSAQPSRVLAEHGQVNSTAPGQVVTAGYLTLRNSSDRLVTVIGASSTAAGSVEIHDVSVTNGVARMRKLETLSIPAGSEVRFAPGGYHMMINGLKNRLVAGQVFPVKLHFASGLSIDVAMRITGPDMGAAKSKGDAHHGHH